MTQQELIERVARELADLPELRALFVGGSYGSGTADAYSDVDLIALAEPADIAAVAARWRQLLERIDRVVFWNELGPGPILLNAITQDWLRCDMLVMTPPEFVGRAKTTVRPLIDRIGCFEALRNWSRSFAATFWNCVNTWRGFDHSPSWPNVTSPATVWNECAWM